MLYWVREREREREREIEKIDIQSRLDHVDFKPFLYMKQVWEEKF